MVPPSVYQGGLVHPEVCSTSARLNVRLPMCVVPLRVLTSVSLRLGASARLNVRLPEVGRTLRVLTSVSLRLGGREV